MQRNAIISSFTPTMRLGISGADSPAPEIEGRPWLELRGTLVDPIRETQDVVFKLWPDPEKHRRRRFREKPMADARLAGRMGSAIEGFA